MISDYFPPQKRSTALAIYSAGIYMGMLVGFLMGGYLNQHFGWRTAFFIVGLPGIFISIWFYSTAKEPERGATDTGAAAGEPPSMGAVLSRLLSTNTFVFLAAASALNVFCIYGLSNWTPSFLQRLHGMKSSEAGVALGLIYGIFGGLGSFGGGWFTDHFGKEDKSWYLRLPAYAILISVPFAAGALFFEDRFLSLSCLGLCVGLQSMYLGPSISVAHSLVPASMRALTSAVFFLVINLVGLGLGPPVVGFISDMLRPALHSESLRWAMSIIILISLVSTRLFFISAKKLAIDLKLKA
jgi:predicted MFS family arabinose efflux permease